MERSALHCTDRMHGGVIRSPPQRQGPGIGIPIGSKIFGGFVFLRQRLDVFGVSAQFLCIRAQPGSRGTLPPSLRQLVALHAHAEVARLHGHALAMGVVRI